MQSVLALLLFALGACIGSFLNVCIWRMPRHESVVQPPSHCPACDTRLQALDLIPLVSQLALRSRCRYCGKKISWRYFGIELLTGALFVLVGLQPGLGWNGQAFADPAGLLRGLVFMATLVVIFWVDYDVRLIQLESVLMLGLAGIGLEIWRNYEIARDYATAFAPSTLTLAPIVTPVWGDAHLLPAPLPESLAAAIGTAAFLWLMRAVFSAIYQREAMGFGDVMLVAAIAANLGWNATLVTFFFLSFTIGAVLGTAVQIPEAARAYRWAKRRRERYALTGDFAGSLPLRLARRSFRRGIPFGPMLAIGGVTTLLYGERITMSYLALWR